MIASCRPTRHGAADSARTRTSVVFLASVFLLALAAAGLRAVPAIAGPTESPRYATLGVAVAGGAPARYQSVRRAGLPVTWARIFANPRSVPATYAAWPEAVGAHRLGLRLWISVWLEPTRLASGALDGQVTRLAASLPPGTRFTLLHEPSFRDHHLSPPAYKAAFEHGSSVIQRASGGRVLTGPIEIRANILSKHYLDGLNRKYVQFAGIDGYDGIGGGPPGQPYQAIAGAAYAHIHRLFPAVPTGFAEFNTTRTTGRPQWIADALAWGRSVGASPMILFMAFPPYTLSTAEQQQLARIIST